MPYLCLNCRRSLPAFHLSCPDCGAWSPLKLKSSGLDEGDAKPVALSMMPSVQIPRVKTGVGTLDKLLGNGFVPGSSVLLAGEPGSGKKSTRAPNSQVAQNAFSVRCG